MKMYAHTYMLYMIFKELCHVPSKFMLLHKSYSCNKNITRRDVAISSFCLVSKFETSKISYFKNIAIWWRPFYNTVSILPYADYYKHTINFL